MPIKLTIRYIKSFEFNIVKYLLLDNLDENMTISQLKSLCIQQLSSNPSLKRFQQIDFDSFKIYHVPGSNKSSNRVINTDHDEMMLKNEDLSLKNAKIGDEFELSFFNKKNYLEFLRK